MPTSRISVYFAPGALLIYALLLHGAAVAAQLRCASRHLDEQDKSRLDAALRATLSKDEKLAASAPGICSNDDFARAFYETIHQRDPQGFERWWDIFCSRDRRRWTCERTLKQLARLELRLDGLTRDLSIQFDADTPVDEARKLARRAFEIMDADAVIPACDDDHGDRIDPAFWKQSRDASRPGPHEAALNSSVSRLKDGNVEVDTSYSGLVFVFSPAQLASERPTPKCFAEVIMVD